MMNCGRCNCALHLPTSGKQPAITVLPCKDSEEDAKIRPEIAALEAEMVALRRKLHGMAELSFCEKETSALIAHKLQSFGLDVHRRVGAKGTCEGGIYADLLPLDGKTDNLVAFRADMDALPITETTGLDFSAPGDVMHACGHDAHMAMLLTTVEVMCKPDFRAKLTRGVRFIFQHAEENADADCGPNGGAAEMVRDGVLEGVEEVYGMHVWNYDACGNVGVRYGPCMANCDTIHIEVEGEGGHGSTPQGTVDAVVVAANLVSQIQNVVARNVDPLLSAVVTVGSIHGGEAPNVIADKVTMSGTVRTYEADVQDMVENRLQTLCRGVGEAHGASIKLNYLREAPAVINISKDCCDKVRSAASKVAPGGVHDRCRSMASEDFAFFLHEKPGCFFFIGSCPDKAETLAHHVGNFRIDESCMAIGASVWLQLAEDIC